MSFPEPRLPNPSVLGTGVQPGCTSFTDYLAATAPHLLPGRMPEGIDLRGHTAAPRTPGLDVPHGTTIVALTFAGGVVIAGDRRATMGNMIAQRDIEKVFITDSFSAVGIAGSAGIAVEMVRLFTVQLEHYEKIEGVPLSLDGKANQLAAMVRGNLGAALQGFVVIPLFAGYDTDAADRTRPGGSSPSTPPAAATRRSWASTRSAPARCSPAGRSRSCTTPPRTWAARSARPSSRSTTPRTTTPQRAGRT